MNIVFPELSEFRRDKLKIIFSPSESKSVFAPNPPINQNSFCCKNLYKKRVEVIDIYQKILDTQDYDTLYKIFGLKEQKKSLELASMDIKSSPTCKAVQRYTGVAYEYLNYDTIPKKYQIYIDKNVIIFSNLFGPIFASDNIPLYRLKQGSTLDGFKTENFYKKHFSSSLDKILKGEFIIDLRAGFYEKFYKIPYPHITMKFIKNGRVVSHWAKAYRGIVLRNLALYNIDTLEKFKDMEIENLRIKEIIEKRGRKVEFVYEIL